MIRVGSGVQVREHILNEHILKGWERQLGGASSKAAAQLPRFEVVLYAGRDPWRHDSVVQVTASGGRQLHYLHTSPVRRRGGNQKLARPSAGKQGEGVSPATRDRIQTRRANGSLRRSTSCARRGLPETQQAGAGAVAGVGVAKVHRMGNITHRVDRHCYSVEHARSVQGALIRGYCCSEVDARLLNL